MFQAAFPLPVFSWHQGFPSGAPGPTSALLPVCMFNYRSDNKHECLRKKFRGGISTEEAQEHLPITL